MQQEDSSDVAATAACREMPAPTSRMQEAIRHAFSKAAKVRLEGKEPFSGVEQRVRLLSCAQSKSRGRPSSGLAQIGHRIRPISRSSHLQEMARKGGGYSKNAGQQENRLQPNANSGKGEAPSARRVRESEALPLARETSAPKPRPAIRQSLSCSLLLLHQAWSPHCQPWCRDRQLSLRDRVHLPRCESRF